MKKLLFGMWVAMLLTAVSSCTDKNITTADTDTTVPVGPSGYQRTARMGNGTLQRLMVVDGLTGDLANMTSSASWLTVKQDGQDGEQRPVILLTVDGESDVDRTATVTLTSKDNKQVSIAVKQQQVLLGATSSEEFLPDVTPLDSLFYKDWFKANNGKVYITETNNKSTWRSVALPWAESGLGTVPLYICTEMKDTKEDWRLVYSTLGVETAAGANFFVLLNMKLEKLRFFYYIPAGYISLASSACFILQVYNPNSKLSYALNSNEPVEMPDTLHNSGKITIDNNYDSKEHTQNFNLVPIGTGGSKTITSGWVCFDVMLDHGYTDVSTEALEDTETTMRLRLATTVEATINTIIDLKSTGSIDLDGVSLTRKGSALQAAATFFNGLGSNLFSIGTGVHSLLTAPDHKVGGGVVQVVGAGLGVVGTILNTAAAAQDSKQTFSGSAKVDLKTKGTMSGTINFDVINSLPAISFHPSAFKYKWESLLTSPAKWTATNSLPTYGLINLTHNPVVYVSEDHILYSPAKFPAHYAVDYNGDLIHCDTGDDEQFRYLSFLDPSSIGVFINKESMNFKFDSVEISTSLFVNTAATEQYTEPNPYVAYYQLKNDSIKLSNSDGSESFISLFSEEDKESMRLVACKNEDIPTVKLAAGNEAFCNFAMSELPCKDKSITSFEDGFKYRYYGLTSSLFNGAKRIVVDPVIYVPIDKTHSFFYNRSNLGPVYLSVCARLINTTDKTMLVVTKHFAPEVRGFKSSEISKIKSHIEKYNPTVKTFKSKVTANFIDNQWLKERAYKMLELAGK
jgi:hypothetical protein